MTTASVVITVVAALFIMAIALGLMRSLAHEMSRAPHATAFQRRYLGDSDQRDAWRKFVLALGNHELDELRRSLK